MSLRVVQLSTNDVHGGAAIAAHRLHRELRNSGSDSRLFVVNRATNENTPEGHGVMQFRPFPWLSAKPARMLYRVCRRLQNPVRCADDNTLFSLDWTLYGGQTARQLPEADIYHLHWIVDLLDYRAMLPGMAAAAPLVWTLHDMNVFTGGCHYAGSCDRFTGECGCCPKLAVSGEADRSRKVLRRKRAALREIPTPRLKIVAPSRWLAGQSQRSSLFQRFEHEVIPNGLDLELFRPAGREAMRAELGLAAEERVLLFVADWVVDRRKGFAELLAALDALADLPHLRIVTIGQGDLSRLAGEKFLHLGAIRDPRRMAAVYSAADVFVIPSLEDNLPNTILEAMACGTPVVGFDTGGVAEAVVHGATGLLARLKDTTELAGHLRTLLGNAEYCREMGFRARQRAVAEYDVRLQAERYRTLYESMLSAPAEKPGAVALCS